MIDLQGIKLQIFKHLKIVNFVESKIHSAFSAPTKWWSKKNNIHGT